MQLAIKESLDLACKIVPLTKGAKNNIVICPDYAALPFLGPIFKKTNLLLGAQDSGLAIKGPYTGELSPLNLKSLGVRYVILGHSERREHLQESSFLINKKLKAALASQLIPIICVGEKLSERRAGRTKEYLRAELRRVLRGIKIKSASDLLIAYEPVWAISTNKKAQALSAAEAGLIHDFIARTAWQILKKSVAVIYGGSVTPLNGAQFLSQASVAGLLVGGASLKAREFSILAKY